jgi:hypothetical protein
MKFSNVYTLNNFQFFFLVNAASFKNFEKVMKVKIFDLSAHKKFDCPLQI